MVCKVSVNSGESPPKTAWSVQNPKIFGLLCHKGWKKLLQQLTDDQNSWRSFHSECKTCGTEHFPIFGVSPCTPVRILKLKATSYSTSVLTALHWLTDQLSNDHLTPRGQSEDIYRLVFAVTLQPACHFSDGRLSWRGDSGVAWGSKPADWSINTAEQKAPGPAAIQVQQGGPSDQLFFFCYRHKSARFTC